MFWNRKKNNEIKVVFRDTKVTSIKFISNKIKYNFDGIKIENFFFPYHSVLYVEINEIKTIKPTFISKEKEIETKEQCDFYTGVKK